MANINDKVTYTIIEEADYNDVVKTTMDGVRLLRTDDEEMYMCIEDINKIIPSTASAFCVQTRRSYDFDVAKWGWVRVKFTNNGYYVSDTTQRATTFVNTRLVFNYLKHVEKRKDGADKAKVLELLLDAAVEVFDKNPDWTPFCATTKKEYDSFVNKHKYRSDKAAKDTKATAPVPKAEPVISEKKISPVVKVDTIPHMSVCTKTTSNLETLIKELGRIATTEGIEITITVKAKG